MSIALNRTKDTTLTITVEYAGESAGVTYYPRRVTKSMIREIAETEGDGLDKLIAQIEKIVASWEILQDDQTPFPVTAAVMAEFPVDLLIAIMKGINEAAIPGEGSGASS